jgi:hypothetical protein
MDLKYYSSCLQKHVLSSFLKDISSDLGSKIFRTCIPCRAKNSKKRKALQPLCPNVPSKRRTTRPTEALTRPKLLVLPSLLEARPEPTSRPPLSILPLLIPRPLASVLPSLLDAYPGPIVLPALPESRPLFKARTRPSLFLV